MNKVINKFEKALDDFTKLKNVDDNSIAQMESIIKSNLSERKNIYDFLKEKLKRNEIEEFFSNEQKKLINSLAWQIFLQNQGLFAFEKVLEEQKQKAKDLKEKQEKNPELKNDFIKIALFEYINIGTASIGDENVMKACEKIWCDALGIKQSLSSLSKKEMLKMTPEVIVKDSSKSKVKIRKNKM